MTLLAYIAKRREALKTLPKETLKQLSLDDDSGLAALTVHWRMIYYKTLYEHLSKKVDHGCIDMPCNICGEAF